MKNQSNPQNNLSLKYKVLASCTGLLAAILIAPFSISAQTATTTAQVSTSTVALPSTPFIAPKIEAGSAVIYDPTSKTFIYEKNGEQVRSIASLTKILTAMIAKDIVNQQKFPTKIITLKTIIQETKADRELKVGEQWTLDELLRFMLTTSSNTGAETIGSQIIPYSSFISMMNFKAKNLGLTTIKANNTSGLPIYKTIQKKITETPGAVGSAKDVALLMSNAYASYPELVTYTTNYQTTFTSILNGKAILHIATSTNELLTTVPNIVGGKTGFTEASGGNLTVIIATPNQRPVIIVVLGSTVDGRFKDVTALASSTWDFFTVK
ncbi:MAG: serine hydrolase [Patescibacteria group bacterium]